MEELKIQLSQLFEDAPKTRNALELKEELYANSVERYNDLLQNGVSHEDAIQNVIQSIGDVSELFVGLDSQPTDAEQPEKEHQKKQALIRAASGGLYIFGVVVFIIFTMLDNTISSTYNMGAVGLIFMLIIFIVPTCMLIYNACIYPEYRKKEDTIVEDFKEWNSGKKKSRGVKGAVYAVLWSFTLVMYFVISFATRAWHLTWILFLVTVCIQAIITLLFALKENGRE